MCSRQAATMTGASCNRQGMLALPSAAAVAHGLLQLADRCTQPDFTSLYGASPRRISYKHASAQDLRPAAMGYLLTSNEVQQPHDFSAVLTPPAAVHST